MGILKNNYLSFLLYKTIISSAEIMQKQQYDVFKLQITEHQYHEIHMSWLILQCNLPFYTIIRDYLDLSLIPACTYQKGMYYIKLTVDLSLYKYRFKLNNDTNINCLSLTIRSTLLNYMFHLSDYIILNLSWRNILVLLISIQFTPEHE